MENFCFAKIILYNLRTIFLDYRIRAEMDYRDCGNVGNPEIKRTLLTEQKLGHNLFGEAKSSVRKPTGGASSPKPVETTSDTNGQPSSSSHRPHKCRYEGHRATFQLLKA